MPHWTTAKRAEVLKYVRAGMGRSLAAELAGFNRSSLWRLLEREQAFATQLRQAEADARGRAEVVLFNAGSTDWRAALEWLKRRYRSEWGDRVSLGSFEPAVRAIAISQGVDADRLVYELAVMVTQQARVLEPDDA